MGGSYVGMACLLSFVIGGNIFHNYLTRFLASSLDALLRQNTPCLGHRRLGCYGPSDGFCHPKGSRNVRLLAHGFGCQGFEGTHG